MKKLLVLFLLATASVFAAYTQVDGVWCHENYAPTLSASEHYDLVTQHMQKKEYEDALRNALIVLQHFPGTLFYSESLFFSALCYFHLGHLDLADRQLTHYLNQKGTLKHFEEVFSYKFAIAERYRKGVKRHPFGIASLPRIASGKGDAIALYDEIVATLPSRSVAAKALYSKGLILRKQRERKESIEVFQTLTRRFPKHPLAADAYLRVAEIYVENAKLEAQNPDLLAHAKLNLQSFEKSFPADERVDELKKNLHEMKEHYALSLFKTGRFYEKKKKPHASLIYYKDALARYPETDAAAQCRARLSALEPA